MPSFGENLKSLRRARTLSQDALAQLIQMHPTQISMYEWNQTNPSIQVLRSIAEALNVYADQLIYGNSIEMAREKIQDNELNMFS